LDMRSLLIPGKSRGRYSWGYGLGAVQEIMRTFETRKKKTQRAARLRNVRGVLLWPKFKGVTTVVEEV